MKKQNITFVSYASRMLAEAEIRDFNYRLNSIKKALATKGEDTIEEFMAYQADPTHKRSKVLAECEAWMDASHCPDYLREENRQTKTNFIPLFYFDKANKKLLVLEPTIYVIKQYNESLLIDIADELEKNVKNPSKQERIEQQEFTLS